MTGLPVPDARRVHFLAIFVLALALLGLQVVVTRIASVTLYYHFAFASVTFAMLGLTAGALKVYGKPRRFTDDRLDAEMAVHACWARPRCSPMSGTTSSRPPAASASSSARCC